MMSLSKKILCLGNNSEDTDVKTRVIAHSKSQEYHGLITEIIPIVDGYYQTSIYDIEYGKLVELIKLFDEVVILDQPKAAWTHPDAFYNTIRIAKQAEEFVKVTWLDQSYSTDITLFEELVTTNKSFCIFPFIELLVNNGSTTVCCRSFKPITKLSDLTNFQTDLEYKKIRDSMLAGESLPEHCSTCYNYESKGMLSARQQETVEWANRLNLTSLDDLASITSPVYYEVRASNVCNLQCRMCGPESSNLIEKEYKTIGIYENIPSIEYTDFEFIDFTNLTKLYVSGGEPTAMPEFYDFLQTCIDQNNTSFEFLVNTNATKISKKLLDLFAQFSNLQFVVSIDGLDSVNHYIRWPSEWMNIINNVHVLKERGHIITFNTTVSIYNITNLYLLLQFFDTEFPTTLVHCQLVGSDDNVLSPFLFPESIDTLKDIINLNCYKNDPLLASFIDGLIAHFNSTNDIDVSRLTKFFEFNDKLDRSRNVKLADYIPELDNCRKYIV
jgi:sulfatase maturation enzyme AslB (radical SAM superfamily)